MKKPDRAPSPTLNVYFSVGDVQTTLRNVVEKGGTVLVPKTAIPNVGWFAMFSDPEGIPVGILQEEKGNGS